MEGARTMMLQLKGASKEFGSGKNRTVTLQDINFDASDGEIIAILGPSGCGKTTLLRIAGIAILMNFLEGCARG